MAFFIWLEIKISVLFGAFNFKLVSLRVVDADKSPYFFAVQIKHHCTRLSNAKFYQPRLRYQVSKIKELVCPQEQGYELVSIKIRHKNRPEISLAIAVFLSTNTLDEIL